MYRVMIWKEGTSKGKTSDNMKAADKCDYRQVDTSEAPNQTPAPAHNHFHNRRGSVSQETAKEETRRYAARSEMAADTEATPFTHAKPPIGRSACIRIGNREAAGFSRHARIRHGESPFRRDTEPSTRLQKADIDWQ